MIIRLNFGKSLEFLESPIFLKSISTANPACRNWTDSVEKDNPFSVVGGIDRRSKDN